MWNGIARMTGWAMAAMLLLGSMAQAQVQIEGQVTATGTVELKKRPEIMRMQIELTAEGKTLKEALTKLVEKRNSAKSKLAALDPAPSLVELAEPVEAPVTNSRQEMERMMRMNLANAGKKPQRPSKTIARASVTLTAEWPLKVQDADERLLFVSELQARVRQADLAEIKKASLAEQEEMEEAGMNMDMGMGENRAPGEPMFIFVGKISSQERDKAFADAFARARERAVRLAKAGGVEVGRLRHLSGQAVSEYQEAFGDYGRYPRSFYNMVNRQQSGEEVDEAIGATPASVKLRITVTAGFSAL